MKAVEAKAVASLLVAFVSLLSLLTLAPRAHGEESAPPPATAPASPVTTTASGDGGLLPTTGGTPDDYVIKIEDSLTIDGNQHSKYLDPRRLYIVGKDGSIKLVFLKRQMVAGLTKRQLEEKLEQLYDPDYFKNLVITVEVRMQSYEVMGEVKMPGTRELTGGTTVLKAVVRAGGFSDYANEGKVVVLRADGSRHIVDCTAILKGRVPDTFVVQAGDVIWVPRTGFMGI
ncbi:MAG: polysaccharide biosynthesis/export family protein [bacterium]|nr:polysaccharide biosynthesis/export family protein [bacterium]